MQTNDNLNVTESVKITIESNLSVFDVVGTTSLVADDFDTQSFGGFGGFYFGQSYFADGPNYQREQNESVTVDLLVAVAISQTVSVSETIQLEVETRIAKSESITTVESISVVTENHISETDNVTVNDFTQAFIPTLLIDISELVNANESAFILIPQDDVFSIIAQESISTNQSFTVLIPQLNLMAVETIQVDEQNIQLTDANRLVPESVSVVESIQRMVESTVASSDLIAVSESTSITKVSHVQAQEAVSISDSSNVTLTLEVIVEDQIQYSENIELLHIVMIPRMTLLGVG